MSKPTVAVLGLGLMGGGMAGRLLAGGFPVVVYNRSADKAAALAKAGARVANSPREAASGAQIIISMLADDVASRNVWMGDNGALSSVSIGAVLIESSTVSVGWIRELSAAASDKHCSLLDAPVTGSKPQAAAGELTFLVGGTEAALETARPALAAMSRSIVHLGPSGSGALVKLINNFVCGVQVAAIAEALAWIERTDLGRARARRFHHRRCRKRSAGTQSARVAFGNRARIFSCVESGRDPTDGLQRLELSRTGENAAVVVE